MTEELQTCADQLNAQACKLTTAVVMIELIGRTHERFFGLEELSLQGGCRPGVALLLVVALVALNPLHSNTHWH